jgi:hypothetical protein
MATTSSPYGLKPINLIGGQPFAGQFREYKMAADVAYGIFAGDIISLTSAGVPQSLAVGNATPTTTAITAATPTATVVSVAGIIGVCVGVRFVSPVTKQPLFAQYIPANAVSAGYTDIYIRVLDDPDALFTIQGSAALGTFNSGTAGSGWPGAVGKNAAVVNFRAGSTATGNSAMNLVVGVNGASLAATATLAMRIVDVVEGTESDTYPEFVVKFNHGLHSYYVPLGV